MDITQTKSEGLVREFDLVFSSKEIEEKLEQRLMKLGQSLKIDGFRPGKIPLPILKQRYESSVKSEVLEQALQDGTRQIIDQYKLRVALQPEVTIEDNHNSQALRGSVVMELLPDIEKIDLSKVKLEQLVSLVDNKEVEEAIENLRKNHAALKPVDEKTRAKKGHVVYLTFKGTVEGRAIAGGSSDGMDLELGSETFIPGFEENLIGLKAGDKKEFDINFPEEYQAKDLAGKTAHFAIEIKEIKEKVVPELTLEFAQKFEKSSIDDLKKSIWEQLAENHNHMSFLDAKRTIMDQFSEKFTFDIPQGLVELEFKSIWEQLQREMSQTSDGKKDPVEDDEEELKKQYRQIAERRVRLGLLLAEIGREHNIVVSQKAFERALMREAMKYPGMERKVIDYYHSNKQAQAALRAPLFEDRVIELILEKATVHKKEVLFAELKKRFYEITEEDEV